MHICEYLMVIALTGGEGKYRDETIEDGSQSLKNT